MSKVSRSTTVKCFLFFFSFFSFLKISKYIWDPARGGVLEGGDPGGGVTPPRHGCCVQAPDYIWDPARGGVLEGGGPGRGLPPPRTAAVSKYQTISGTQHEGACSAVSTLPRTNLASLYLYANPHFREQI